MTIKIIPCERRSRGQSRSRHSSWPPTTTWKHICMWSAPHGRQTEAGRRLLRSQRYRESHTKSGLKGGEEVRSASVSLGGRHRERITQSQRSSLGNEDWNHTLGTPHLGSNTGRARSLNTFENQLQTDSGAVKKLYSARKGCSHAHLITKQGRPSLLKLPATLTGISHNYPSVHADLSRAPHSEPSCAAPLQGKGCCCQGESAAVGGSYPGMK